MEKVSMKKRREDPILSQKLVFRKSAKRIQKESTGKKSVYLPLILQNCFHEYG